MGTIAQHRVQIKLALDGLAGNKFDYEAKSFPAGPRWIVSWPEEYDHRVDMGTSRSIIYPVRFEVPWGDDESSDDVLETAMEACVAAIEADRTLAGTCEDLSCLPFTNIGASRLNDESVVMQFTVPVEVYD